MAENKRFMLDDAGELIDKETAQFIEYGEKVCDLLNGLSDENEQLKSEYKVLHTQYQDLKKFVENNFDEHSTQEKLNRQILKLSDENEQLKEEKHNWLQQKARYEQQYTEYIKENKNLKAQLYSDEDGICNQCKYHYLVKDEDSELGYYNSRCRKGHYECARVSLRYCEDFEIENGD